MRACPASWGRAGKLGEIATWATRNPSTNDVKLADGAGQYRAIGRMLTLPNLKTVSYTHLTLPTNREV